MGMPAAKDGVDVVLLFGGDGTIHRHLEQLVRLGLPLLVVPVGSGNDVARSLGLRRVRDSLVAWRKFCGGASNVRAVDLGVISALENADGASAPQNLAPPGPRYFCCIAGVGLDGEVARRANLLPRWLRRHGGYELSVVPAIFTFAALSMKILTLAADQARGTAWSMHNDQPTLLAAFANTPSYGGGMKIAPRAKMDDGLLDVCIVGRIDRFRLLRLAPTVYSGRHLNIPEVDYFQTSHARVETEHPLDVYADGEYVCRTPIQIGVEAAALKVLTLG